MDVNGGTDAEEPYVIRCQVCDRWLMGLSYPVVYRPKTRDDLNLVRSGARCVVRAL